MWIPDQVDLVTTRDFLDWFLNLILEEDEEDKDTVDAIRRLLKRLPEDIKEFDM